MTQNESFLRYEFFDTMQIGKAERLADDQWNLKGRTPGSSRGKS